jgi:hypothetical protein
MTVQLTPDLEAAVTDEARRSGTTPELVVQRAIQDHLRGRVSPPKPDSAAAAQEKMKRILAVARDFGVSHSNEALSSQGLYD